MGLFARLEHARLQEQSSLQQLGLTDPLEIEFTTVVSPVMESCTKEAISVSVVMCVCVCVCVCVYLFVCLYTSICVRIPRLHMFF